MQRNRINLRLSQALNTKINGGKLSALPLDANPFADWSAHLFAGGQTQYIILSNSKSLYSTVMQAKGITSGASSWSVPWPAFRSLWKPMSTSRSLVA